jgi:hypothetical protein
MVIVHDDTSLAQLEEAWQLLVWNPDSGCRRGDWTLKRLVENLNRLDCFCPLALIVAKLRRRETGAASPTSPTRKRTADEPRRVRTRRVLACAHSQNQLATTIRTFTFLHSPFAWPFERPAAQEQPLLILLLCHKYPETNGQS